MDATTAKSITSTNNVLVSNTNYFIKYPELHETYNLLVDEFTGEESGPMPDEWWPYAVNILDAVMPRGPEYLRFRLVCSCLPKLFAKRIMRVQEKTVYDVQKEFMKEYPMSKWRYYFYVRLFDHTANCTSNSDTHHYALKAYDVLGANERDEEVLMKLLCAIYMERFQNAGKAISMLEATDSQSFHVALDCLFEVLRFI